MISAFGIEHNISKSFVPRHTRIVEGVREVVEPVVKPASQLTPRERRLVLSHAKRGLANPRPFERRKTTFEDRRVRRMAAQALDEGDARAAMAHETLPSRRGPVPTTRFEGLGTNFLPTRPAPGKGQRSVRGSINIDASSLAGLSRRTIAGAKKHEPVHAEHRKPLSTLVRQLKHPEKLWGDEARANAREGFYIRRRSGYNLATAHPDQIIRDAAADSGHPFHRKFNLKTPEGNRRRAERLGMDVYNSAPAHYLAPLGRIHENQGFDTTARILDQQAEKNIHTYQSVRSKLERLHGKQISRGN